MVPSSTVEWVLANWKLAFGRICICVLWPTRPPTDAPKENVRLEKSVPPELFRPEPDAQVAAATAHAFACQADDGPPTLKSNDDPLRPS